MGILKDARVALRISQINMAEALRDAMGAGSATGQNMLSRIERYENAPPSSDWLLTACSLLSIEDRYAEVVEEYAAVAAYQAAQRMRERLQPSRMIAEGKALANGDGM